MRISNFRVNEQLIKPVEKISPTAKNHNNKQPDQQQQFNLMKNRDTCEFHSILQEKEKKSK